MLEEILLRERHKLETVFVQTPTITFTRESLVSASVSTLILHSQPITNGLLPDSVTALELAAGFKLPLGELPSTIHSLTLNNTRSRRVKVLPIVSKSITSLTFGDHFAQSLKPGSLPPCLISLVLGNSFDRTLTPGVLPPSLQSLVLGHSFNQILQPGSLPSTLTSLTVGHRFDQRVGEELHIGIDYHIGPLYFTNMMSLTRLKMDGFRQPIIEGMFPQTLTELDLGEQFEHIFNLIPSNVHTLTLTFKEIKRFISMPPSVKHVHFIPEDSYIDLHKDGHTYRFNNSLESVHIHREINPYAIDWNVNMHRNIKLMVSAMPNVANLYLRYNKDHIHYKGTDVDKSFRVSRRSGKSTIRYVTNFHGPVEVAKTMDGNKPTTCIVI
ncbi:hypothetical protein SAMD00019534_090410 [Acytostelium subglobosum LB1]|uniref:hypothetical protein n=1 Tax=Acytostelium subglobosum LB1 TaxID=1410327 RepID=UPI0006450310|nr:hypothetical protein SAMD00019534_090410 [Acytostelium subglobosum LB1]GAM25866.1 hypothetical protein SAMD00019534_090410 [Acytostelium subglobosum LB1]|eukprot:XP_012751384.1 hypothetical protein SAMD00019534_090410 [Acytostelium subglobosum LB1]